jgi:hypothetical protein
MRATLVVLPNIGVVFILLTAHLPLLNLGLFNIAAHVSKQIVSTKWEIAKIAHDAKDRRNIRKNEENLR